MLAAVIVALSSMLRRSVNLPQRSPLGRRPYNRVVQDAEDHDLVRPHVEPGGPLERIFGAEDDRKGWGRATIRLLTHPLHRMPTVEPQHRVAA